MTAPAWVEPQLQAAANDDNPQKNLGPPQQLKPALRNEPEPEPENVEKIEPARENEFKPPTPKPQPPAWVEGAVEGAEEKLAKKKEIIEEIRKGLEDDQLDPLDAANKLKELNPTNMLDALQEVGVQPKGMEQYVEAIMKQNPDAAKHLVETSSIEGPARAQLNAMVAPKAAAPQCG